MHFSLRKKKNRYVARVNQYPASPKPKTMEAIRILQCMDVKSSRPDLVCLQYCLMGHKEEKPGV